MTYNETLDYLYNRLPVFHQIGAAAYKPGLEKSFQMMNKMGDPQDKYLKIHVAGTNGKGSVSHFLSAVLQSAGYKVGLYTSPHLVDFRERIRVNGEKIDKQFVVDFVKENENYFDEIQPSFFEATMAMSLDYFAACNVDIAVIEVGLGGRLDSTNIILPVLSVITNIGFDHTEFLGDTLEKIAFEKAGIIKKNIPVVIGETQEETKSVFLQKAHAENSPIFFADETDPVKFIGFSDGKMIVESAEFGELLIGLTGEYQLKNIATVLKCVEILNTCSLPISLDNLKNGLSNVVELTGFQGRWQIYRRNPDIILDTGHNKEGIRYVAHQLKSINFNKLHFIFGCVNDKDIEGILSFLPANAVYYFTAAQTKRALQPSEIKRLAEKYHLKGSTYETVEIAIKSALQNAKPEDLIFIGGSNFIVGDALIELEKLEENS